MSTGGCEDNRDRKFTFYSYYLIFFFHPNDLLRWLQPPCSIRQATDVYNISIVTSASAIAATRAPVAIAIAPPDESSLDSELVGALVGGSVQVASEIEIGPSSPTELKITSGLIAQKTLAGVCCPDGFRKGSKPE